MAFIDLIDQQRAAEYVKGVAFAGGDAIKVVGSVCRSAGAGTSALQCLRAKTKERILI